MKRNFASVAVALMAGVGVFSLAGCGGGTSVTINSQPPSISSFTAGSSTIEAGTSTSLTAIFSNGTGVITPGNLVATSGTPVSVSPTTTTTYTLTVTGISGSPATATTTVTVSSAPSITSFAANPATIEAGSSTSLTAVFSGGTGVVTPGNIAISSGTPVSVSPAATTTYTLTVTPPVGTVNATAQTTVTISTGANITSFTASPAEIEAGSSSQLTGYFSGGSGVITGTDNSSYPATSGTAVVVSPATTTTYTLTVTPTGGGTAATKTAMVTVDPVPTISSFTANPTTIAAGNSSSLTASFNGGAGVITPGNLSVTSGAPVSVSPTATTTYTLTVTPPVGSVNATQQVTVTVQNMVSVNPSAPGIAVTNQILGMNLAAWYDVVGNATSITGAFGTAGIKAIRWPGGSWSDQYHWGYQTGSSSLINPYMCTCSSATLCSASSKGWAGYSSFAQFVNSIPKAGSYDLALTADYGTNEACTAGGDPAEAAAWVTAATSAGVTVSHMTVGNEEYGNWETDLHAKPNDPTTYASAVIGNSGFYDLIKLASPSTLVGVDVDAAAAWDGTVLKNAAGSYDFVEYHYYPQGPGQESDTYLTQQGAQGLTANIKIIKQELVNASEPDTPIYVGEMGSVYSNPGKQTWSITQGLYAGQMLGEMMNDGVARATWWIGFGNCNGDFGNDTSSVYGWQDFGAYNVFADGYPDTATVNGVTSPCDYDGAGSMSNIIGTLSPTAVAYRLFSNVAVNGEHVLTPSVMGDTTNVRAYAATHSGGTALVLFNLNETATETVVVSVTGKDSSPGVTEYTYDKELYDYTNTNCQIDPSCTYDPTHNYSSVQWVAPTTTTLGSQPLPLTLTLEPWSMNVVIIQ